MSAKLKSLDQQRAAFAWEQTGRQEIQGDESFKPLASGAPALVMANGLMQTLAFYKDKKSAAHRALREAVETWLTRRIFQDKNNDFESVMSALYGTDSDTYMRATEESLEILKWIRQFAKARGR